VRHLAVIGCYTTNKPKIDIISPEHTESVKTREAVGDLEHGPNSEWACTHCVAHIPRRPMPHADVVKHLQERYVFYFGVSSNEVAHCKSVLLITANFPVGSHDIDAPQDPVDLVSIRQKPIKCSVEYKVPRPLVPRNRRENHR
jgi:hypothetical protein